MSVSDLSSKQTLPELSESTSNLDKATDCESAQKLLNANFGSTSALSEDDDDDSEAEIDTTTISLRPMLLQVVEPVMSHTIVECEMNASSVQRHGQCDAGTPNALNAPKFGSNTSLSTMSDKDAFDNKSTASSVCESDKVSAASEVATSKMCKKCIAIKASAEERIEEIKSQLIINESKLQEKDDEIMSWKKKFEEREVETKTEMNRMQSELSGRLERAFRALEAAKKDKESAVMKYAFVEQDIASKQKTIEVCEKRRVACEKEASSAIEKMKQAQTERAKMRQLLESKDNELILSRKESDRLKLDLATFNQKLKGSESRVQKEIDCHKETQSKVGLLSQKLKEVKEELDTMKKDCQELIKKYQNLEASRCQQIDDELKVKEDVIPSGEISDAFKCKDFEYLRKVHRDISDEVTHLREELSKTKDHLKISESCLRENKDELMLKDAELSALKSRMKAYAVIEAELSTEKAKRIEVESERQREVSLVNDVEQRINDYQCKEKEYLEYTEKLTNKITDLQFQLKERTEEGNKSDSKLQQLRQAYSKLEFSISQLKDELKTERETRHEENSLLLQKLEEKTKAFDKLMLDFEEDKNRAAIRSRKMETSLKDVSKQLHQMKKRKEALEQRLIVISEENENSKLASGNNGSQSTLNELKDDVGCGSCDSLPNLDTSSGSAPSVVTTTTDSVDMENFTSISSYAHSRTVQKSGPCNKGYNLNNLNLTFARSKDSVLETSYSTTSAASLVKKSSEVSSNMDGSSVRSNVTADVEIAQPFRKGTVSSGPRNAASGGVVWVDQYPELDKNMLVDKLIRMQKQQNKLREKTEFLEDQSSQLAHELKTKNKVIQYYLLREETGTLGTDTIAFNKLYMLKGSDSKGPANFKQQHHSPLSSTGHQGNNAPVSAAGKLSSLFGSVSNSAEQEHGMQLQRELNARLQSVLEDTILKNIKLQENLDVLSKELQHYKERTEKDSICAIIAAGEPPFSDSSRSSYSKPSCASSVNNSANNKSIASSIKSSNCIAIQRNKHSLIEAAAL